ncbi:MAG: GerMN domain-containing protein, partial [Bacilli bacterium]|nr:GerMN domain-containing protein [Bacilli bacterium]
EFLNLKKSIEKKTIDSIVYSIFDLKEVKEIFIEVEGKLLNEYPNSKEKIYYPLDKSIGINNEYNITSRNDINKTVIYYLEQINNEKYYVPVTKYENTKDDKIKVIIDSLTTNYIYEPNLMSVLNTNLKLNGYNKEDNVFFLDFNNYLYDKNQKLVEEVIYSISYSVFDNYDVNNIVFMIDGKNVKTVMLNDVK